MLQLRAMHKNEVFRSIRLPNPQFPNFVFCAVEWASNWNALKNGGKYKRNKML